MSLSKPLNCCLYFSLEVCGTAQSLGPVMMGDIAEGDEEAELTDEQSQQKDAPLLYNLQVDMHIFKL